MHADLVEMPPSAKCLACTATIGNATLMPGDKGFIARVASGEDRSRRHQDRGHSCGSATRASPIHCLRRSPRKIPPLVEGCCIYNGSASAQLEKYFTECGICT
jgi:hypothetical protein